jgi:hypothetical protein
MVDDVRGDYFRARELEIWRQLRKAEEQFALRSDDDNVRVLCEQLVELLYASGNGIRTVVTIRGQIPALQLKTGGTEIAHWADHEDRASRGSGRGVAGVS